MSIDYKNYIILHVPKLEDKKELNKILHSRDWSWIGSCDSLKDKPLYVEEFHGPRVSKEYFALCLKEKKLATVIFNNDMKELKKFLVIEIESKPDKKGWFF